MNNQSKPATPDLKLGIAVNDVADGDTILGHVGEEEVLLVRCGATSNDDECRKETFFCSLNRQGATALAESSTV